MIEHFEKIWWEDSWLLGWEKVDDQLILFVDLHILGDHPNFTLYDRKKEFGCYKTARLVVGGLQSLSGLPSDRHAVEWNGALEGYKDVGDIDVIEVGKEDGKLAMEVGAANASDCFRLEAEGQSIDLIYEALRERTLEG